MAASAISWNLPLPKICSPALKFHPSVRTGVGLSIAVLLQKRTAPHRGADVTEEGTGIDLFNVWPGPLPGQQQSTGLLHLDMFDSRSAKKENHGKSRGSLFWSRVRESNPTSRLGKPLYYRYTNPASESIVSQPDGKFNLFLSNLFPAPGKITDPIHRRRTNLHFALV